jgi:hypothetical protein
VDDQILEAWLAGESEDLDALWRHVLRRGIELEEDEVYELGRLRPDRRYANEVGRVTG